MMNHQQVNVEEEIATDAANVWQLIRNFGDISAWASGIVVNTQGSDVGMIRQLDFNSDKIVERCEAHDDALMSFTYRLLESPWPMSDYVATVTLTRAGPDKTLIEWSSTFQAVPEQAEAARNLVENTYRKGFIARLRKTVARQ
jgi:carbon monoxide dehydrogenase subunit G